MKLFPLVLSLTSASALLTTGALHAQAQQWCGIDAARQVLISENPDLLHQAAEYELGLQAYLQAKAGLRDDEDTVVYHIPIVFHVLYDPSSLSDAHNVSDAAIYDAVNQLNIRYRKRNADTSEICCGFEAVAADARLQFDLATKDPFGNCTNGIDRITTLRGTAASDYSKLDPWFRDHYMNIWVCNSINSPFVAGYSNYPSDVQGDIGALRDGVMIQSTSLVSFALTHEIGHYLNLQHVWGNNNDAGVVCGDDGVDDTPVTKGYNLICPGPDNSSICDPNIHENYQNYMDYSYCSVMYTEGQRDRMRAALNSDVSGRRTLWQEANHAYTGISGHEVTCGPEADFYALDRFVCQGIPVRFKDNSKRATPTSWAWTFDGGNPATSTEENPIVSFDEPGEHAVTLTVGNDHGSSSTTKNNSFIVGADYSQVDGLLHEPFNTNSDLQRWPTLNLEGNNSYWHWNDQVGHDAPGSAVLNASNTYTLIQDVVFDSDFHDKDLLVTPMLDLRFVQNLSVSFWYAYSSQSGIPTQITENLKVYASTSCGMNWSSSPVLTLTGPNLVTAGVQSPGYVPLANEWRQATFNLSSFYAKNNVRLKFEYSSGLYSNDIFIDDVNIEGTNVGIDELAQSGGMSLMPNPASNSLTVALDMAGTPSGTLTFLDMTGRSVYSQAVNATDEQLSFDLGKMGLTSGVYLVRLKHVNGQRMERLVVR